MCSCTCTCSRTPPSPIVADLRASNGQIFPFAVRQRNAPDRLDATFAEDNEAAHSPVWDSDKLTKGFAEIVLSSVEVAIVLRTTSDVWTLLVHEASTSHPGVQTYAVRDVKSSATRPKDDLWLASHDGLVIVFLQLFINLPRGHATSGACKPRDLRGAKPVKKKWRPGEGTSMTAGSSNCTSTGRGIGCMS